MEDVAADVLYHLLVMLAARDVTLDDVLADLHRREGTPGIAEKGARLKGEYNSRVLDANPIVQSAG